MLLSFMIMIRHQQALDNSQSIGQMAGSFGELRGTIKLDDENVQNGFGTSNDLTELL